MNEIKYTSISNNVILETKIKKEYKLKVKKPTHILFKNKEYIMLSNIKGDIYLFNYEDYINKNDTICLKIPNFKIIKYLHEGTIQILD